MEKVRYLMTKKELVRVHVIKSLIEDKMTSRDAAEVLSLSERQIKRLKAGVKKDGEVFVIHKNRGRKPKHTIPVSYTHLRAHETRHDLVCRLLLEKKKT